MQDPPLPNPVVDSGPPKESFPSSEETLRVLQSLKATFGGELIDKAEGPVWLLESPAGTGAEIEVFRFFQDWVVDLGTPAHTHCSTEENLKETVSALKEGHLLAVDFYGDDAWTGSLFKPVDGTFNPEDLWLEFPDTEEMEVTDFTGTRDALLFKRKAFPA